MENCSSKANYFSDCLRIKVGINLPHFIAQSDYKRWVKNLLGREDWSAYEKVVGINSLSCDDFLFLQSFIQTLRLFCELGRLPVFDYPRLISLSKDDQISNKVILEIELSLVNFCPMAAYQIPIKTSLEICQWMAQHSPTPENINKAFTAITEKVIKPLHKIIPAGKSTIPVLRVAHELGIPFTHLGLGVYQLGWGSKARRLDRSTCEMDSAIGSKLAQNKVSTANILRLAGLPSPTHQVVTTEIDALTVATQIGFPVVIKPMDCDRGEGVSVDVNDSDMAKLAFTKALELSKAKRVIVERQVPGVCHRLFIANGSLLYAVKRLPMSVVGDGRRTVAQLVIDEVNAQKQKAPWNRSEIQPIDERALRSIAEAGFSLRSVPAKGVLIPLRRIESTADGGVDEEVTAIVHPDNLSAAITATKLFGLNVAGIDIISLDISKPWYANGAIINEVNFAPLFGGGEISRSHIPRFFKEFIDGDGKIPIESFETEGAALERQKALSQRGLRCYFTTPSKTIDYSGNHLIMPFNDIRQRLRALACQSDVDAITFCLPKS